MAPMEIRTYLSHSYRLRDQATNEAIWTKLAEKSFAFFVDPPSSSHQTAHLEKQMLESSCFVAIVPFRSDAPVFHCSPFMLYEIGLAIQARRPKLILVDDQIGIEVPLFSDLDENERIRFNPNNIEAIGRELEFKLDGLRERALPQAAVFRTPTRRIGLVTDANAPADRAAQAAFQETASMHALALHPIALGQAHNALLLQEIDSCDAVILDCRQSALPAWITACLLVRPVPTVKLVHVAEDEAITEVALHPMIAGTKMDSLEPMPEHLLFWRSQEDLRDQLVDVLGRIHELSPSLEKSHKGLAYFKSIGRRKAKIFISNSGAQRNFAATFSKELQENNVEFFHYKRDIEPGELWQKRLRQELKDCDGFIAFIDAAYLKSEWSQKELKAALARRRKEEEKFFFQAFNIGQADVGLLGEFNAGDLDADDPEAHETIIVDIDAWLKQEGGEERKRRRSLIPGGTREWLLDVIRHLPEGVLQKLRGELGFSAGDLEFAEQAPEDVQRPLLSRRSATRIIEALHRDDTALAAATANEHPLIKFFVRLETIHLENWRKQAHDLVTRLRRINLDD